MVKVWPDPVEAVLRGLPGVDDVAIAGVRDDEWGERVVAVADTTLSLEQLRDFVAERYARTFAPRALVRVDELPLLPNGKVDRLAVERLARG